MKTNRIFVFWISVVVIAGLVSLLMPSYGNECPVTHASDSPVNLPDTGNWKWFGSDRLAAAIPGDGVWYGMGPDKNFGDKFWWWRRGYTAGQEPAPDLRIVAVKADDHTTKFVISGATNAIDPFGFGDAILIGMAFPSSGCWQVRGIYNGVEDLEFTLWVGRSTG